jgi:hypothetical protein
VTLIRIYLQTRSIVMSGVDEISTMLLVKYPSHNLNFASEAFARAVHQIYLHIIVLDLELRRG